MGVDLVERVSDKIHDLGSRKPDSISTQYYAHLITADQQREPEEGNGKPIQKSLF